VESSPFGQGKSLRSIDSIQGKVEIDTADMNVDASVKASNVAPAGSGSHAFRVSEAFLRGLYVTQYGRFPRWCIGASIGLVGLGKAEPTAAAGATPAEGVPPAEFKPYRDPFDREHRSWRETLRGQLKSPLASVTLYQMLDRRNKLKWRLTTARQLTATLEHRINPQSKLDLCLDAMLPDGQHDSLSAAGAAVKTTLGVGFSYEAD